MVQIQFSAYFLHGPETKNEFYIFKGLFKKYAVTENLCDPQSLKYFLSSPLKGHE